MLRKVIQQDLERNLYFSGLGYMVGSSVAHATGQWRWGLRVTPFLNLIAVVLMIFFLEDPERGKEGTERIIRTYMYVDDICINGGENDWIIR